MGGYAYIQDSVMKVALVPSEEHAHLLQAAPECSAVDEELALRLASDRWGSLTEARITPAMTNTRTPPRGPAAHAARGPQRRDSRTPQTGTPASAAPLTSGPLVDDGGEGVGRSEVQARFDILAVTFEERLKNFMQTQAETAAQLAQAKAAETAAFEAAQQEKMLALRQQQQAESGRLEAMLTRLGTVETQLSATQLSAEQAAAGLERMMTMLQMQQTLMARLCQSADDTQSQLRRLTEGADKQLTVAAPPDNTAVCPLALAIAAPTLPLG
jgi:hypothetical protein